MVERRSPKPEVGGSIPSAPAKMNYEKPIKIYTRSKQEAFRVTWPTGKETVQGSLMVVAMAIIAAIFFFS